MNSSTSVYLVPTSTALSSAGITQNPDPPERAVWIFVLVEMLYIVIFIVIMVIIHFTGYMMVSWKKQWQWQRKEYNTGSLTVLIDLWLSNRVDLFHQLITECTKPITVYSYSNIMY